MTGTPDQALAGPTKSNRDQPSLSHPGQVDFVSSKRTARRPSAVLAAALLALFPATALLAPLLARSPTTGFAVVPFDPLAIDLDARLKPPGTDGHPFGTDDLGRDVLSRLLHGSRASVATGLLSALLALGFGTLIGAAGGLRGGLPDRFVLFWIDVFQAIPPLVLVAGGAAFLTPSFLTTSLLIAATAWSELARLVRAEARRVTLSPFVESARAGGASEARVLRVHVLPHALRPALAVAPYVLASAVLAEAALSFLGLGTPPPMPSWGRALADGGGDLVRAPWCAAPPGVALFLLIFAARKLGDALDGERPV